MRRICSHDADDLGGPRPDLRGVRTVRRGARDHLRVQGDDGERVSKVVADHGEKLVPAREGRLRCADRAPLLGEERLRLVDHLVDLVPLGEQALVGLRALGRYRVSRRGAGDALGRGGRLLEQDVRLVALLGQVGVGLLARRHDGRFDMGRLGHRPARSQAIRRPAMTRREHGDDGEREEHVDEPAEREVEREAEHPQHERGRPRRPRASSASSHPPFAERASAMASSSDLSVRSWPRWSALLATPLARLSTFCAGFLPGVNDLHGDLLDGVLRLFGGLLESVPALLGHVSTLSRLVDLRVGLLGVHALAVSTARA